MPTRSSHAAAPRMLLIGRCVLVELRLVDEDAPRLRSFIATDDASPLQHVDRAGRRACSRRAAGAGCSETDAVCVCTTISIALSSSGSSSGSNSPSCVVASGSANTSGSSRYASSSSCSRWRVCSTTSAISSSETYAPWTRCSRDVPSGLKSMSPWPSSDSAPPVVEDHARVRHRRHRERDARRHVRLDHAGDHVDRRALRREHEVDADGARLLREPDHGVLDRLRRDHHQVGELVDHDEQIRHRRLAALPERAVRLVEVARAHRREPLVAALHLRDAVGEHGARLLRARHDRREQVRNRTRSG